MGQKGNDGPQGLPGLEGPPGPKGSEGQTGETILKLISRRVNLWVHRYILLFFFKYLKVRKETLDLLGHPDLPVHLESCLCCLLNCFSKETVQLAARNATRKAQKIYRMTAILEPLGISQFKLVVNLKINATHNFM